MFKFSLNWLKDYCGKDISKEQILNILKLQGFEFQGEEKVEDDIVTEIEVKADRPDMLCHMGIAREISAYKNEVLPSVEKSSLKIDNSKYDISIENSGICKRFTAIKIKNINNNVQTPSYIESRLKALGINTLNPVVNILNYVMLDLNQPLHCYDLDNVKGEKLSVLKSERDFEMETLTGKAEIKKGDIIISDDEKAVCVAGIIGLSSACVSSETKNVLIEAAVFDPVSVRLSSRRLRISTPSSFRFERGVDIENTINVLNYCAKMITEICGGEICSEAFDYYPNPKELNKINLNLEKTNSILGTNLEMEAVLKYLEKYGFKCNILNKENIEVTIPSYRITTYKEIDLISELSRIYGYENIPIVMPTIQITRKKNEIWNKINKLRNLLLNLGFSETINYSFIPENTMSELGIKNQNLINSSVMIQNPISKAYSLMRPTLVYSLVNCLSYNYSIRNTDLAIFEIGRTYFKDSTIDTGYKEVDSCGFIMSGIKIPKGWGQSKDIKYDYYDLISYLDTLMNSLGQKYELKEIKYDFAVDKTAFEIIVNGKKIGFVAKLNKKRFGLIKNIKLIKDDIFYCEFSVAGLELKDKKLKFESKFPPVKRLYNFVHNKNVSSKQISENIKSTSEIIREIEVKDVYIDKNMPENVHAVLYEVNYCDKNSTLTSEEVEAVEEKFIKSLEEKFGAIIKK